MHRPKAPKDAVAFARNGGLRPIGTGALRNSAVRVSAGFAQQLLPEQANANTRFEL
jgi:hypothetical protein